MPASNFTFVASLEGPTAAVAGTVNAPNVSISFERCSLTNPDPPFENPGSGLEVFINFDWTRSGSPINVQGFSIGDIQIQVEDDTGIADRIRLGTANSGRIIIGELQEATSGEYNLRMTLNPNSAGTVWVTVFSNSASTIPVIGVDSAAVYGPPESVTASFGYSTLAGTLATTAKPRVDIIVPTAPIFTGSSTDLGFVWNSEIKERQDRTIGPDDDDDIKITGTGVTFDVMTFTHTTNTMQLPINLTGSGECTIRVKQDSETSISGETGPSEDITESFLFDTTLPTGSPTGTVPSGTPAVIYDSGEQDFNSAIDPMLGTTGGAFKGVSDLKLIGNNFYGTVQIQNRTQSNLLDQGRISRAILFRIPNQPSATATILNRYESMDDSPRSLTELNGQLYYFQGSYHREESEVRTGSGTLQSIPLTGTSPISHGVPWRSRLFNPNAVDRTDNITYSQHIQMSSPMVTVGNSLYLHSGYGAIRSIKSTDWESTENREGLDAPETRIDNWTLLEFGDRFGFRNPVTLTNGKTGYEVIQEMARLCFSYIGFDGIQFIFRPKFQPVAALTSNIAPGATVTSLAYTNPNMIVPTEGFVRIAGQTNDWEIFSYTGRNDDNNQLTGVQRAQSGTEADELCNMARMEFIDHIIDMEEVSYSERPINTLNMKQDLQQLYNIITIKYGSGVSENEEVIRDETSIQNNKPRKLDLTVDLDHHDSEWVFWLAEKYRDFYGKIRYIINLQLKPSFYIKVGQFILLREKQNSLIDDQVFQVLIVTHQTKPYLTELQLRSIS